MNKGRSQQMPVDDWFDEQERLGRTAVSHLVKGMQANLEALTKLKKPEIAAIMRVNKILLRECLQDCGMEPMP